MTQGKLATRARVMASAVWLSGCALVAPTLPTAPADPPKKDMSFLKGCWKRAIFPQFPLWLVIAPEYPESGPASAYKVYLVTDLNDRLWARVDADGRWFMYPDSDPMVSAPLPVPAAQTVRFIGKVGVPDSLVDGEVWIRRDGARLSIAGTDVEWLPCNLSKDPPNSEIPNLKSRE